MNTVSFPNLGLDFTLNPIAFNVFGIDIMWYAIIIAVGFLLAVFYVLSHLKHFGLDEDRVMDVIIFGMIGGIVGARAYFVIFSWEELYKDDWTQIFNTRSGGLAIYGGLIGALLVGALLCRIRKVKMLPMFDIAALGFLIGQGIGRWGNFVNVEAYGSKTDSLFGMTSSSIGANAVHPCFLYESIWCIVGFFLLHWYLKRRRFDGELILLYCAWYGLGRCIIEGLRTDSLMWGPFRVSQMLSVLLCVAGLLAWVIIRSKIRRNNDDEYLKLYVYTGASKQMLEEAAERRQRKQSKKQVPTVSVVDSIPDEEAVAKNTTVEEMDVKDQGKTEE